MDFAVPTDHRVKLEETEKSIELARELKKLWKMKVIVIPIVTNALGTVSKWLEQGLEDLEKRRQVENIQARALLRSAGILRRVLETLGNLVSLTLQWKPIS